MEIGQKVIGFSWEAEEDELYYNSSRMNSFIGKVGVVIIVFEDRYMVSFGGGAVMSTWDYPMALKERGIIKPVVGEQAKGFRFESMPDGLSFNDEMEGYVGKVGVVKEVLSNRYRINFEDGEWWWYPLDKAWKSMLGEVNTNTNTNNQLNVSTMRTKGFYVKPNFGGNRPTGLDAVKWTAYINFINEVGDSHVIGNSYSNGSLYGITMSGYARAEDTIVSFGAGAVEINLHDWWAQFVSEYLPSKGFIIKNTFCNDTEEGKSSLESFRHRDMPSNMVKWRTCVEFLNHIYDGRSVFGGDGYGDYYGVDNQGLFNNSSRLENFPDCTVLALDDFWNMITGQTFNTFNIQAPTAPEPIVEEVEEDEEEVEMVTDYLGDEQRLRDCIQIHDNAPSHGGEYALERDAVWCEYEDGYCVEGDAVSEQGGDYFFIDNQDIHDIVYSEYDDEWLDTNRDDVYHGYVHGEDGTTWFVLSGWGSPYYVNGDNYRDSDALEYHGYVEYDDDWISQEEYNDKLLSANNATYHSHERMRYGFEGIRHMRFDADAKFTIGFEIEKEDDDAVEIGFYDLYNRTGWVKEEDGSLCSDTGYELVSPAFDLYANLIDQEIEADEDLQTLINAGQSSNCGGHINLASSIHSTEELFELLSGYFPLFYSIYKHRVDVDYSKAKKKHKYYDRDKRSAIFIKPNVLEFRIPSAVKNVSNLLWRRDLLRIMCSSIKSEKIKALNGVHYKPVTEADVLKMLVNPTSKLYKHMRKVFSHEAMIKKVELFIEFSGSFNNTYLPRIVRAEFPTDNINNNVEHDQDGMGA